MRYEKKTERKDTGTDTDVSPGPQRNLNGGFEGGRRQPFLLLEQCQQGAVRIGEIIEQSENECSEIIGSLEAYCEWLYEKVSGVCFQ